MYTQKPEHKLIFILKNLKLPLGLSYDRLQLLLLQSHLTKLITFFQDFEVPLTFVVFVEPRTDLDQ